MPKKIYGTEDDDALYGTTQDDDIYGGDGNDMLRGFSGVDVLNGEDGNDSLYGGLGDDVLVGGQGDDWLDGADFPHRGAQGAPDEDGADVLKGGGGDDTLRGGTGEDWLYGDSGNDTASYARSPSGVSVSLFSGYAGGGDAQGDHLHSIENLFGSDYSDNLSGDDGKNVIDGDGGDDAIFGFGGADTLTGSTGHDSLYGGDGNDRLDGGTGNDELFGHAGDDKLKGGSGADHLDGGAGTDLANYSGSNAAVRIDLSVALASGGHATGDKLVGIECLLGSSHDDKLSGDNASNWLGGGLGTDILKGNGGADTLQFHPYETGLGADADCILDFSQAAGDKIQVSPLKSDGQWGALLHFAFIGDDAFSGEAGELRFEQSGSDTWISGDSDGDAVADFQIKCVGTIAFTANDFIL
jgi:Ca2+-binding RTX toxin-like protein